MEGLTDQLRLPIAVGAESRHALPRIDVPGQDVEVEPVGGAGGGLERFGGCPGYVPGLVVEQDEGCGQAMVAVEGGDGPGQPPNGLLARDGIVGERVAVPDEAFAPPPALLGGRRQGPPPVAIRGLDWGLGWGLSTAPVPPFDGEVGAQPPPEGGILPLGAIPAVEDSLEGRGGHWE